MGDKAGVLDSHYLGEALKGTARKLGERCGAAAVERFSARLIQYIGSPDDDRYSYIWRSAIEEHDQDAHKDSARTVLVDAVRDAALGVPQGTRGEAKGAITGLLQSPYPTVARIGIYVCGERYGDVGPVFWELVKPEWFFEDVYWHELYWLIKKAFPRFSTSERTRFLSMVEQTRADGPDVPPDAEMDERHRRDLLHAATGHGDAEVESKYQSLVEHVGPVSEHLDFRSYSSAGWVGERSPVASDELVRMSDADLMALMMDFVPDARAWGEGPSYRGLASSLSSAVRASADGFASRLEMFLDVARPYQHGLFRGLKERWQEDKHDIAWEPTLSLLRSLVSAPSFRSDLDAEDSERWEPSVHWLVSDIAALIKAGSSTERPIAAELHLKCVELLQLLLSLMKSTPAGEPKDPVSHASNSPRGRVLDALINLALAMRRHEVASPQNGEQMWAAVRPVLDRELTSSESGQNADFAALAGLYCPNLHYLNAGWVEANFDRLFSKSSEAAWMCAAHGFAYQRHMYPWLYARLVAGGHLRRMVFAEALPDSVSHKALQFLALAYLDGLEEIDGGGLMSELIAELKTEELVHLTWFFWTLRISQATSPTRVPRILAFWRQVAAAISASGTPQPHLQSELNFLAAFIDELTPELAQLWSEAAPHAQVRHHGYVLVEHMARLSKDYPGAVASVFRAALSGFLPEYKREDVIRCVVQLAESDQSEDAQWLCNQYAARQSTLLNETYEALRAAERSRLAGSANPAAPSK
jgi:hypothetical protein